MAKFEARDGKLFLDGKEVLRGWESLTGWFWFATVKIQGQVSLIERKEAKDTIWFGFAPWATPRQSSFPSSLRTKAGRGERI
jgi:hypothetical protein